MRTVHYLTPPFPKVFLAKWDSQGTWGKSVPRLGNVPVPWWDKKIK